MTVCVNVFVSVFDLKQYIKAAAHTSCITVNHLSIVFQFLKLQPTVDMYQAGHFLPYYCYAKESLINPQKSLTSLSFKKKKKREGEEERADQWDSHCIAYGGDTALCNNNNY